MILSTSSTAAESLGAFPPVRRESSFWSAGMPAMSGAGLAVLYQSSGLSCSRIGRACLHRRDGSWEVVDMSGGIYRGGCLYGTGGRVVEEKTDLYCGTTEDKV